MMEVQVKIFHPSELRLWRTGMLFLTKSKGHKSNAITLGMSREPQRNFIIIRTCQNIDLIHDILPC